MYSFSNGCVNSSPPRRKVDRNDSLQDGLENEALLTVLDNLRRRDHREADHLPELSPHRIPFEELDLNHGRLAHLEGHDLLAVAAAVRRRFVAPRRASSRVRGL